MTQTTHHLTPTHRYLQRALPTALLLALAGCFIFVPRSDPSRYAETIVDNLCHITYDCCAPEERSRVFVIGSDKESCREEGLEGLGALFVAANDAIARGAAVYDAELAERCTAETQAAIDQCDLSPFAVASADGASFNTFAILFAISPDSECQTAAFRGFTRGTVAHGDDCESSFDCENNGNCQIDENDDGVNEAVGTCDNPASVGEDCSERFCGQNSFCNAGDVCEAVELAGNGDPCSANESCESGFCEGAAGSCSVDGGACQDDFDCDFFDAVCTNNLCDDGETVCEDDFECPFEQRCDVEQGECAAPPAVDVQICDGV